MRLLFIHSKPFSFKTTEPTRFAEEIGPETRAEGRADDALVVMFAPEKPDERSPDRVVAKAALEIEKARKNTGAKTIVLYPYAHLSNNLCAPEVSLVIIKKLREALAHHALISCPFGWHKSFQLNGVGLQASEMSRAIEIEQSEITRSMNRGHEHPVAQLVETLRRTFLDLGLDEVINPAIIEASHIHKQYGPDAPLKLDGVFHLAETGRAEISLGKDKEQKLLEIMPGFDRFNDLRALLGRYNEAAFEAGDFLGELALRLDISGERASEIIEKIFPEFRALKPAATTRTLLTHAANVWLPMMQRMRGRAPLPIRLFSIGPRYRRLRGQAALNLAESTSASIAVMAKDLPADAAKKLAGDVLKKIGFEKMTFRRKKTTARCFDIETESGIYVRYQGEEIDIGGIGYFAPKALADYGIDSPVFCIDLGVERISMILSEANDLRSLVNPLMYEETSFDDEEMARLLRPAAFPSDEALKRAAQSMALAAAEKRDAPGPVEVAIYSGPIAGRNASIAIYNWDDGKPMLSLAAMNDIYVHRGSVYGLPRDHSALGDKYADIYRDGINTGLNYLELVILGFAAEAEKRIEAADGPGEYDQEWKIIKRPINVNLDIPEPVHDFIQRSHKSIKVGGPLFFGLHAEWE